MKKMGLSRKESGARTMKRSTTAVCPASNSSTTRSRGRPGHTNLGLLDALPAEDPATKVVIMAVFA